MSAKHTLPLLVLLMTISSAWPAFAWSTTVILGDFDGIASRCTDAAFGDIFMSHGYNAAQVSVGVKSGVLEWGGDELSILGRNTGLTLDSRGGPYKSELSLRFDQHFVEELVLVFIDESDYRTPGFRGADITVVSGRVSPSVSISTTTLNEKLGGDSRAWGELAYQVFKPQISTGSTHHTLRISVPSGGRYRLLAVAANSGNDGTRTGRSIAVKSAVLPLDSLFDIEDRARYFMELCAVRERVYYY